MLNRTYKRKISVITIIVYLCIGLFILNTQATILYVDKNADTEGTGTSTNPYNAIQKAIDNASNMDTINVRAGIYIEDLVIDGKGIKIVGEHPEKTTIKGAKNTILIQGLFSSPDNVVEISGFTISDAVEKGIGVNSSSVRAYVHNNIISYNHEGLHITDSVVTIASNNTIVKNSLRGLYLHGGILNIYNNIFFNNIQSIYRNSGDVNAYNNNFDSQPSDYRKVYIDNINVPPLFVNADSGDFRLKENSPSIDAGRKIASDRDPDGTRNDQGVYGGPGAAAFWPKSAGGPVVTECIVTPYSVSKDGTISLRAKAKMP